MDNKEILDKVNKYYTEKIIQHGTTPKGVDWNGQESQYLRFEQLCKVIGLNDFSVLDYGCGFGSLYKFLEAKNFLFQYFGYDISDEMIAQASLSGLKNASWLTALPSQQHFDYVVASGIFNVKLETNEEDWLIFIKKELDTLNQLANKGFSFNMLTSYSDKPLMKDYLYYASPEYFFKYCKENCSKNVAILHDYNLYEFTIIVKK